MDVSCIYLLLLLSARGRFVFYISRHAKLYRASLFYINFRAEPLCHFYSSIIKPDTFQISVACSSHSLTYNPQVVTEVHEDLIYALAIKKA